MAASVVYTTFSGMIVHENRGGTERDYMPDPLGSTAALLNDAQTKTDTWDYWPNGEVITRTGSNPTPFTFVGILGYFKDLLDKLLYVRTRFLQPNFGRWLSPDSLPKNRYRRPYEYCVNRPVDHLDPSGLDCYRFVVPILSMRSSLVCEICLRFFDANGFRCPCLESDCVLRIDRLDWLILLLIIGVGAALGCAALGLGPYGALCLLIAALIETAHGLACGHFPAFGEVCVHTWTRCFPPSAGAECC